MKGREVNRQMIKNVVQKNEQPQKELEHIYFS